jgi:uncharacterized ParB-like nuclease family protein
MIDLLSSYNIFLWLFVNRWGVFSLNCSEVNITIYNFNGIYRGERTRIVFAGMDVHNHIGQQYGILVTRDCRAYSSIRKAGYRRPVVVCSLVNTSIRFAGWVHSRCHHIQALPDVGIDTIRQRICKQRKTVIRTYICLSGIAFHFSKVLTQIIAQSGFCIVFPV